MKKISLFFAMFLMTQVFYASENNLLYRHGKAEEKYLEVARKLKDFKADFFEKKSSLLEDDQEQLEFMEIQIDGIQRSIALTDSLININQDIDEQLLQGIKGCVIKYEQNVKILEKKYQEMRDFFEIKVIEL